MVHMLIANQLETTSEELSASGMLRIKLQTRVMEIHHASKGADFIMGSIGPNVYCFPLSSILEISGLENTPERRVSFEEILRAQQLPVLIHYHLPQKVALGWLLTVSTPWLRLAHPQGVIWVPLARVSYAEIRQIESAKVGQVK